MAFPLALAMAGMSALSSGISVFGQIKEGNEAYKAAARKANRVIIDSKFRIHDIERQRQQTISRQKATYAASGVKLSGSPLEVMAETNYLAGIDKARTEYEARVTSEEIRREGDNAFTNSRLGALGSVLGGAGKAIGTYSSVKAMR